MKEIAEVSGFITARIDDFYNKMLNKISNFDIRGNLKDINPYIVSLKYRMKFNVSLVVEEIVIKMISSYENTFISQLLFDLAIFVNERAYNGIKSAATGIDLEFMRDDVRYIVSIKSGPNWGNSSQINKLKDDFRKAKRVLRTSGSKLNVIAVDGCCYGKTAKSDKDDYYKICGEEFWSLISGDYDFYLKIIEPLGHQAKEMNYKFHEQYSNLLNRFAFDFTAQFCDNGGAINWKKLTIFNSGKTINGILNESIYLW